LNGEPCRLTTEAVSLKLKMIVNIAEGENHQDAKSHRFEIRKLLCGGGNYDEVGMHGPEICERGDA